MALNAVAGSGKIFHHDQQGLMLTTVARVTL